MFSFLSIIQTNSYIISPRLPKVLHVSQNLSQSETVSYHTSKLTLIFIHSCHRTFQFDTGSLAIVIKQVGRFKRLVFVNMIFASETGKTDTRDARLAEINMTAFHANFFSPERAPPCYLSFSAIQKRKRIVRKTRPEGEYRYTTN